MAVAAVQAPCPNCQQMLVVDSADLDALDALATCPRCAAQTPISEIITLSTPVPAVVTPKAPPVKSPTPPVTAVKAKARRPRANSSLGSRVLFQIEMVVWLIAQFDEVIAGKRLLILFGVTFAVWIAPWVAPAIHTIALGLFLLLVWSIVVSWVWKQRDEDGVWSWRMFFDRVIDILSDLLVDLIDLIPTTQIELLSRGFAFSVTASLIINVIASLMGKFGGLLLNPELVRYSEQGRVAAVVIGIFGTAVWAVYYWKTKFHVSRLSKEAAAVRLSGQRVPIDLVTSSGSAAKLPSALQPVAKALSQWKPRRHRTEYGYARHLRHHLEKRLGVEVQAEVILGNKKNPRVGRVDLVIDSVIALELKRGLRGAQADRAVGQAMKYLENWRLGPVLVVVCEADSDFEQRPEPLRVLEATGGRVAVIAAGNRQA